MVSAVLKDAEGCSKCVNPDTKKGIACYLQAMPLLFHSFGVVISLHKLLYELDGGLIPFHKSSYLVIAMG